MEVPAASTSLCRLGGSLSRPAMLSDPSLSALDSQTHAQEFLSLCSGTGDLLSQDFPPRCPAMLAECRALRLSWAQDLQEGCELGVGPSGTLTAQRIVVIFSEATGSNLTGKEKMWLLLAGLQCSLLTTTHPPSPTSACILVLWD